MNETQLAWRVGIVVICAVVILAILILLFGEGWQSQYTVFVETPTAPNVTVNTPVTKNGIRIGRVSNVENRDRSVLLTLKISTDESIYSSEVCRIGTASILGDAMIQFAPGSDPDRGQVLTDRQSIPIANVTVDRNPVEVIDLAFSLESQVVTTLEAFQQAGESVDGAAQNVEAITSSIQDIFQAEGGDLQQFLENTRNLTTKAETAIDNFNEFMLNINEFAGDPQLRGTINEAIAKLPEILDEVNATVADTRKTINGFRGVSENAEENLANLTAFTESLGANGPELIETLNRSIARVDSLVADIGSFTEGLSGLGDADGTISKLLNDPELYNNLNDTIRNARDITSQLKPVIVQLQPLMNDVRYTMDGLARDTGQIGLRGLLNNQQPFSQFKGNVPVAPLRR